MEDTLGKSVISCNSIRTVPRKHVVVNVLQVLSHVVQEHRSFIAFSKSCFSKGLHNLELLCTTVNHVVPHLRLNNILVTGSFVHDLSSVPGAFKEAIQDGVISVPATFHVIEVKAHSSTCHVGTDFGQHHCFVTQEHFKESGGSTKHGVTEHTVHTFD